MESGREHERRIDGVERGLEKQGERLGKLETTDAVILERLTAFSRSLELQGESLQAIRTYITNSERQEQEATRRDDIARRRDRISLAVASIGMLGLIAAAIVSVLGHA